MVRYALCVCIFLFTSLSAYALDESSQWVKAYTKGFSVAISSVERTFDGGYIAIGTIGVDEYRDDALLIRLNSSGKLQWANTYGANAFGSTILQTADGGFLFAGDTLVKVDPAGNILWQKTYKVPGMNADFFNLIQAADGGFFLLGAIGPPAGPWKASDVWCMKLNSDGAILWQKFYGRSNHYDEISAAVATSDGGLIFVGAFGAFGGDRLVAVKIGPTGSIIWQKVYTVSVKEIPGAEYHSASASTISTTADGGYVIGGSYSQYVIFAWFSVTGWVAKLDSKGNVLWQRAFYSNAKYEYDDTSVAFLRQEKDGHILAMGTARDGRTRHAGIWSARLDSAGNLFWKKMFGETAADEYISAIHDTADDGNVFVGNRYTYPPGRFDGLIGVTSSAGTVCTGFRGRVKITSEAASITTKSANLTIRNGKFVQKPAHLVQAPVKLEVTNLCSVSAE